MAKEVPCRDATGLLPLEANPETFNHFLSLVGFDIQKYQFVDVFSTSDEDLLNLVPRPVVGLLLVKPSSAQSCIIGTNDTTTKEPKTEIVNGSDLNANNAIWHTTQTIGGACGSIAVLHLVANIDEDLLGRPVYHRNSWLERFLADDERLLDEEFRRMHMDAACHWSNQTSHSKFVPGKRVGNTFTALVPILVRRNSNDQGSCMVLVELDGRKEGPIPHGTTSRGSFLADSCKWIEQVMADNPDGQFAILALAAKEAAKK